MEPELNQLPIFIVQAPNISYHIYNPHINWSKKHVESWSISCHCSFLRSAAPPSQSPANRQVADPPDLSVIPPDYYDLAPVFSKFSALSLPPHRPYDCAIDLLPGAPLHNSRLYNISKPERETMENYINESLAAGIIRPSSSPLGSGFFYSPQLNGTTMLVIESSSPLNWRWRNGGTGWKAPSTPFWKLPTALQTAQLLVKHIFKLHGIPQEILSDRGLQFTAQNRQIRLLHVGVPAKS
ncbi:uncharacterized protein LOC103470849 [Poecilia reticulata]|uniref:uncharacterized protein LOC103470849 n=1 Tax=Poecilia reticulata TaxID=8081 RepID=UPI0004A24A8A|nr:PREDICTED: uncharacterized protein LOC103470849 [Poecilia reticulata]